MRANVSARAAPGSNSSRISSAAPSVIALSATLNDGKYRRRQWTWMEVDDVAVQQAVDDVAERAAEDQRERPAEQPLAAVAREHPDDEDRRRRRRAR